MLLEAPLLVLATARALFTGLQSWYWWRLVSNQKSYQRACKSRIFIFICSFSDVHHQAQQYNSSHDPQHPRYCLHFLQGTMDSSGQFEILLLPLGMSHQIALKFPYSILPSTMSDTSLLGSSILLREKWWIYNINNRHPYTVPFQL